MPSKNNKKKAAAERSAKLAAEVAPDAAQEEVAAPVLPPTAEMASLAVSSPSATSESSSSSLPYGPKKHVPYDLPAKLQPLEKNKPLRIITNSFQMELTAVTCYRFDVRVQGQQDGQDPFELAGSQGGDRQRQAALNEIVAYAFQREGLGELHYLYDGAATLYTTKKFVVKRNGAIGTLHTTIDANFSESVSRAYIDRGSRGQFHVVIEPNDAQPTLITTDVLNESLSSTSCPLTQMIQIAMAEEAKRNGFLVTDGGKELFDRNGVRAKGGIEEMLGVGASVKIADGASGKGAAHALVDYKRKNFFSDGPLANLGINWNDYAKAGQFVKGLNMGTTYSRQTFEAIGVSDIPMVQITHSSGSVLETASTKTGKHKNSFNASWPAIQARVGNRVFSFAIETLRVLPNQKLNPKQGSPPRCEKPFKRFEMMETVGKKAHILSPNAILKEFGVKINNTPISTDAVTVILPTIKYKTYSTTPDVSKQAKWEARGSLMIPAKVSKILILFNSDSQDDNSKVDDLKGSLIRGARDLGVTISDIRNENLAQTYSNMSIEEALERKYIALKGSPTYLIYVDYTYHPTHQLLKLMERLYEIPTQHLTFDKALFRRPLGKSTVTNLLLKINAKSLGLNHKVAPDPMIEHIWGDKSNTLFISYDVCHSSGKKAYKKGEKCFEPSCVGFGYNGTQVPEAFIGDFHYQLPRHEQVDPELLTLRAKMMTNSYMTARKTAPKNVIIVRDGVSEGQNAMVRLEEFPAIKAGVMQAVDAQKETFRKMNIQVKDPAFAIIVVLKSNANRFYLKDERGINNVPPMTAVDKVIVKKEGVEIVMVCHHPLNGTAQPVLINMLLNEGVFKKNDEIVRLIATMCCAHQVSTTITSVPEPITVADDYAKRGSDLFTVFKRRDQRQIPTRQDSEGVDQIDFLELTKKLSYFGAPTMKNRRMV